MGLEDGHRGSVIRPDRKQRFDQDLAREAGLRSDYSNAWILVANCEDETDFGALHSVQHYKEYLESGGYTAVEVDYIMQLSKPTAVEAIDRLVDEFNADLERIKREKDVATVKRFATEARVFIYGK